MCHVWCRCELILGVILRDHFSSLSWPSRKEICPEMNASAKTAEMGINRQKGPFYSGDVSDFWHPILNICHILDIAGENRQFRHNCQSPRAGTFFAIIASLLTISAKISIFAKIASLQEATFGIQFKSPEAGDFSPVSPFHAFLDLSVQIWYDPCLIHIRITMAA